MAAKTEVKVSTRLSAVIVPSLDDWAQTLSLRELHSLTGHLSRQFYWWMGWPSAERAARIADEIPLLARCIDFDVLKKRWSKVKALPRVAESLLDPTKRM